MNKSKIDSLEAGRKWVRDQNGLWRGPNIVLLNGPMGAGKTQLVHWILEELGSAEAASPTFAIHHRYQTKVGSVDHFDLFRLKDDQDLESTGFWDLLNEKDNLILIEWAERLSTDVYPEFRPRVALQIEADPRGGRIYHWNT